MIKVRLENATMGDIQALIDNGVREGRSLEYKRELPGNGDEEKKEFLADVSSFANGAGGDLVFGVEEEREKNQPTGIPKSANGLAGITADKEVLRLQQMIRDGIEPRIAGVAIRPIDGFSDGPVIVMRIPRSLAAPHMVTFKNSSRFYSRTSAGKYQLDVHEIRSAFEFSADFARRMRDFVAERVGRIVANDTVVPLKPAPVVVLHVLPLVAFDLAGPREAAGFATVDYIEPFCGSSFVRLNFDGKLAYSWRRESGTSEGYAQLFRSGALEIVDADMCWEEGGAKFVRIELMESKIRSAIIAFLRRAEPMQVAPPYFVIISLLGFRGAYLNFSGQFFRADPKPFDRDSLQTPEVVVETVDVANVRTLMRPAFDTLWQASGYTHSVSSANEE